MKQEREKNKDEIRTESLQTLDALDMYFKSGLTQQSTGNFPTLSKEQAEENHKKAMKELKEQIEREKREPYIFFGILGGSLLVTWGLRYLWERWTN